MLPGLGGFYVQEEDADADADADAGTSEGVFVLSSASVAAADLLTVEGTVLEAGGETRIETDAVSVEASGLALPDAVTIIFPTATVLEDADSDYVANLEAYEGMRVSVPEEMTVGELFQLDRFGTVRLTSEGRSETFTQGNAPSDEGFQAHLRELAFRSLMIDDGSTSQNPSELRLPFLVEDGVLGAGDEFCMGDAYAGLTGVVGFSEDPASSEEPECRIHLPTKGELIQRNPREDDPDVGGTLTVASFNVLNYFTTIKGGTGPDGSLEPRGAGSAEGLARQEAKLVAAIDAISADVIGLTEIETTPRAPSRRRR